MLRYGDECGFPDDWADELLESASSAGDLMTVYSFVYGADINRKIDGHRTAVMHAAANGQFHLVKFLIEENVDLSLVDSNNKTAAEIATDNGHFGIASFINVSENDDWQRIIVAEEILMELRSDSRSQRIDKLLQLPKYASIAPCLTELPESYGDYSWFQITSRVTIGFHNTNGMVFLAWLLDDLRIDDVS